MGFFDDAKDAVEDTVDDIKDRAEEETGIDIDRDGDIGNYNNDNSGGGGGGSPPSKDTIAPDTGNNNDSGGGGDTGIVIDTGDSSSGGSSSGSSSSSSGGGTSSSGDSSSSSSSNNDQLEPGEGLETIIEENQASQKQPENINQKDINKIKRQNQRNPFSTTSKDQEINQFLDQREQELKAERNIQNNKQRIRNAPENTTFTTQNGNQINRDDALDQLDRAEKRIDRVQEQTANRFNRSMEEQTVFSTARENADVERPFTFNNPLGPGNSVTDTVEVNQEGVQDTFDKPSEQSLITGVELMDAGQQFADQAVDTAVDFKQDFDRAVIEANPLTRYDPAAQQELKQGFTPEDAAEEVGRGTATAGSQLGGLVIATPGALEMSTRENTPSLGEGAVKGGDLVVEDATQNTGNFLAQEAGEEISEKAIGAAAGRALGGTIGVASTIPTPDFRTIDFDRSGPSTFDKALVSNLPGNNVLIADTEPGGTPDFVNNPGPDTPNVQTVEPQVEVLDFDTTGKDIQTEAKTESTTQPGNAFDSRPSSPAIDSFLSNFDSPAQNTPGSRFDAIGLEQSTTQTTPQAESTPTFDAIPETRIETEFRPEPRPEPEPTPNFTPGIGFDEPDSDFLGFDEQNSGSSGSSNEENFAPSLTAGLFNIESNLTREELEEEEFTGLDVRPLANDQI